MVFVLLLVVLLDGMVEFNLECFFWRFVEEFVGEDVYDCGVCWNDEVCVELDLEVFVCVVESFEFGRDFFFYNLVLGMDFFFVVVVVLRNGCFFVFKWDSNSMGGLGYFECFELYEFELWEIGELRDVW